MEFIPSLWRYLGPIFTWNKDTRNPLSLCNLMSPCTRQVSLKITRKAASSTHCSLCGGHHYWYSFRFWGLANEQQLRWERANVGGLLKYRAWPGPGLSYASFRKHNEKYCTSITSSQYTPPGITQQTQHPEEAQNCADTYNQWGF